MQRFCSGKHSVSLSVIGKYIGIQEYTNVRRAGLPWALQQLFPCPGPVRSYPLAPIFFPVNIKSYIGLLNCSFFLSICTVGIIRGIHYSNVNLFLHLGVFSFAVLVTFYFLVTFCFLRRCGIFAINIVPFTFARVT